MQKQVFNIFFITAIFLLISMYYIYQKKPDQNVHIVFCDVGQGDSILIHQDFFQILIDSGADDRVLTCLSHNLPFWDRTIELVIATHYDNDHIGGFKYVFDTYEIKSVLALPFKDDSIDFVAFEKVLVDAVSEGTIIFKPFLGQKIRFSSGMELLVISIASSLSENLPVENFEEEIIEKIDKKNDSQTESILSDAFYQDQFTSHSKNELSIALLFTYKNTKLLLSGDVEEDQEKAMVGSGLIKDVDIVKVGHHGSNSSSSSDFLINLLPEVAVVSCGKNNQFGHPDVAVLERLDSLGTKILRTDEAGEIKIVTDGNYYWLDDY